MTSATATLSSTGQVLIPQAIRETLHWDAGIELTLTATGQGVMLEAKPQHRGKRLEDLIGMLQHDGPPVPIEALCRPVDYTADWKEPEPEK
jgi:bifunctional DNA-binding transcriptional regulator/antitoxin component of YhaV-PrlF toxin-antitoxin module